MVIPANGPDPNLCKTLLTAGILKYPAPVIVNWNETFDNEALIHGGSHLAKISGLAAYLDSMDPSQDEDLVMMVDGYDIWFQLRPQVVLDRYFAINARANKRILDDLGAEVVQRYTIKQEIVFSSQKRCWPWTENDPPCYAVPESSLPSDVFGPLTDTDIGFEENPYIKFRPRFINSGVIVGPVRAMRRLFTKAEKLLKEGQETNVGSDQYIFGHITGDQSIWREAMRRDSLSDAQKDAERLIEANNPKSRWNWPESHFEEVRFKAGQDDGRIEYGVGFDYGSEIGIPTVFSETDLEWLTFHNKAQMHRAEQQVGIASDKSRLDELASDIARTTPPFWTREYDPNIPSELLWDDVPLFTNLWTGNTPAVIHHNAHRDGRKALRETWWTKLWSQKYARALFDAWVKEPVGPIAHAGVDKNSKKDWWPAERQKGGGRTWLSHHTDANEETREWLGFDDICKDYHEEVFRDGKGPWQFPSAA